jgi:hypothetical protein
MGPAVADPSWPHLASRRAAAVAIWIQATARNKRATRGRGWPGRWAMRAAGCNSRNSRRRKAAPTADPPMAAADGSRRGRRHRRGPTCGMRGRLLDLRAGGWWREKAGLGELPHPAASPATAAVACLACSLSSSSCMCAARAAAAAALVAAAALHWPRMRGAGPAVQGAAAQGAGMRAGLGSHHRREEWVLLRLQALPPSVPSLPACHSCWPRCRGCQHSPQAGLAGPGNQGRKAGHGTC